MVLLTTAEYKALTGDVTHTDAEIAMALARYSGLIEGYTQRALMLDTHEDVVVRTPYDPLALRYYPVYAVTSVVAGADTYDPARFTVDKMAGLLYHDGLLTDRTVTVHYDAGYEELPTDIRAVLLTLTTGYLEGVSGGLNDLHSVKKETVMGVATVEYSGGLSDAAGGSAAYAELGPYVTVLDRYRATSWA